MNIYKKLFKDYKDSMKSGDKILKYALRSVIGRLRDFEKKYSKSTPENKIYSDKNLIEVLLASCQETLNLAKAFTPIKPRTDKIWESIDELTSVLGLQMTYLPENEIKNFETKFKKDILDMAPGWVTPHPNDLDYLGKYAPNKNEDPSENAVGTGFFVDNKGHIITNYHVVKSSNNKSKILFKHNEISTNLIAHDEVLDLALLKAKVSNKHFIKFSNKSPKKAQSILVAGFPYGKFVSDDLKITAGIINSLKGIANNTSMLQIDATVNPGNSGGPIVDKESGNLVGVATMKLSKDFTKAAFGQESENTNYGIKASQVKDFLEANNINISVKPSKLKISELEESTVYVFCKAMKNEKKSDIHVTSPIVGTGTAYLASVPGGKNFVEVGQKIKKGQPIMIVEAMKTMNFVRSTQDGIVDKVIVKDGELVEFGQPLISIKEASS